MKQPYAVALLAIPLALSACLTEPEPGGPEPPESDGGTVEVVPERPIERPARPALGVEREYRVQAQPPDFPPGGGAFTPPWDPILKHSDALAIAGNGDVHVIGNDTWYHFRATGGPPVATVVQQPGFEEPFAVAMRDASDPDPAIAALRAGPLHPVMQRRDSVTHGVEAVCDVPATSTSEGNWRFSSDASGFWITGKLIILCSLDGAPLAAGLRDVNDGRMRHPHNATVLPGYPARSLEVTEEDTAQGVAPYGSTVLRLGAGARFGKRSLKFADHVMTRGLWAAVEPDAAIGYVLAVDRSACSPPAPGCVASNFAIVPVNMLDGTHYARIKGLVTHAEIMGGLIVIDPNSHDVVVLTSHYFQSQATSTYVHRFRVLPGGMLEETYFANIPDTNVHDAIFVGGNLYVSLFSGNGARLQVLSPNLARLADATYGSPGDYPMALKRSFTGLPYHLMKQGNELVVRKFDLDTDGDGLLDRWETEGIDSDGNGTIDYALNLEAGIDYRRKNILIELDVANGAVDPRTYWDEIYPLFLDAPVWNPDGTTGIRATLLFSENFDGSWMVGSDDDERFLEERYRGDPADHASPNAAAILEAKRLARRHVMVFPYRRIKPGTQDSTLYGRTYGLAGHASPFIAIYDDLGPAGTALYNVSPVAVQRNMRAAILAHELGHAMGLHHGGHEELNYKPNYHSVMNSLHLLPSGYPIVPLTLTFANDPGPTLVEDQLAEDQGLGMDAALHAGHTVRFFTGPRLGPWKRWYGDETAPIFDFDGDGTIESDLVVADLTKNRTIETLIAHSDWDWMDWSLSRSPGWNVRNVVGDAADDDVESLLVASGWCDPMAAAGCTCTQEGVTRPCGTDVGACTAGVQTCMNGFWGLCEGSVPAFPERCGDGDDDCDGTADEDFPALGQACNVGVGACARSGAQVCTADQLGTTCSAVAGTPVTERCSNTIDDDCDGATDEGYPTIGQACSAGVGVCRRDGTFVCAADGVSATCSAVAGPDGGTEVCNNGLDEDCDGLVDEDCLPTPISPPNGHLTGSGRVTSAAGQYNPRQVTFRWAASSPGATYELQVDDQSSFSSPEPIAPMAATSYTTGDLEISQSAPFGRRYFWRVRSRVGTAAWSAWSATRYVDVGRLHDDVNGDGLADVAVSATNSNGATTGGGSVFLLHGRSGLIPAHTTRIHEFGGQQHAHFGAAHAFADLDADGFSDLIVGIPDRTLSASYPGKGQAAVYFGSSSGLPTAPSLIIQAPVNESYANFGFAVASAGDVDGDGYGDVWIAAPDQDAVIFWNNRFVSQPSVGVAHLFRGGPRGSISLSPSVSRAGFAPYGRFGATMAAAGDVDNDGTTDMAFAAYSAGSVFVIRGGGSTVLATLNRPGTTGFGRSIAAGDFNADGAVDLAIAAMSPAGYTLHLKNGATISNTPWYIDNGGGSAGDCALASGDMDRDGDADLLIGYPFVGHGGQAVVFRGGPSWSYLGQWAEGSSQGAAELGRGVTVADVGGDGRADVFAGEPRASVTIFPGIVMARQGRTLYWPMSQTPAFGQSPSAFYSLPFNQADAYFGNPVR